MKAIGRNRAAGRVLEHPPGLAMRKSRFPMNAVESNAVGAATQSPSTTFSIAQAIEDHLPLVQRIARRAWHQYGRRFDHDDLVGYGHLGLVRAAHKYAALECDIRQALDFTDFAKKRIWGNIEVGRDQMAAIHRKHFYRIKRGEMPAPKFLHETDTYCLANVLAGAAEEPADWPVQTDEVEGWLQKRNPLGWRIVDLHIRQGMTLEQVSALVGRSPSATRAACFRAVNLLRRKYNPEAYRPDDRTGRRHRAAGNAPAMGREEGAAA
jgi:DNA-directed RNA polymerase specialized sigma24 family protein